MSSDSIIDKNINHDYSDLNNPYIKTRNDFILSINSLTKKGDKYEVIDYFTPDDIARFVGLFVKEYIGKEEVSILDPMGGSGNLLYHVINTVGKISFKTIDINRFNQEGDNNLIDDLNYGVGGLHPSFKDINKIDITADIIVVNPLNNYLNRHDVFQKLSDKYCLILDTNSPKNNPTWDKDNFSIEKVIDLGDGVGIGGKHYYLYIYKKEKSGENDYENVYYNYSGKYKDFKDSENIFIGKKQELVLGKKSFNDLIKKGTLENIQDELLPINEVLNKIQNSNRLINNNFSKLLSGIEINWIPESNISMIEIIQNIQEIQKIKSEKLYEILISLSVSNFLIFSGPSGVGKTSLVEKISHQILGEYLKFPVKSNFSDETGLLGYWNPLLSKYEGTDVLNFIFKSSLGGNRNRPFFLLLDEMNLSRIENYFSEFLIKIDDLKNGSIEIKLFETFIDTEAKFNNIKYFIDNYNLTDNEVDTKEVNYNDIKNKKFNDIGSFGISIKMNIYSNLHIVGTINEDETTFSLSNKVLDRAFYIELGVDDLFENLDDLFLKNIDTEKIYFDITQKSKGNIQDLEEKFKLFFNNLNNIIQRINPMDAIGYRAIEDIVCFFNNYKLCLKGYLKDLQGNNVTDLAGNNLVTEDGKQLQTEDGKQLQTADGKNITLDFDFKILDYVLCQKVWPKMKNYFLLGDKESEFDEILKLLEVKGLDKESESYKKINDSKNILINN